MAGPGRNCPLHYRYPVDVFAEPPAFEADVLYVAGGLYGNPYALDALLDVVAREQGRTAVVFNGDFHWFDIEPALFASVNRSVLEHRALRGNVETEIALPGDASGCGCAYPEWVSDAEVERSNEIIEALRGTARAFPEARSRIAGLPMHLVASVGGVRVGIVHGDAESLSGWRFSQESLRSSRGAVSTLLASMAVDIVASTHTCLPVAERFETHRGTRWLFNSGAAGMPNFAGDGRGLVTRIALEPSRSGLYGARAGTVHAEAVPIDGGGARWLRTFDRLWPAGSPAAISYRKRIACGPSYRIGEAVRAGIEPR